MENLNYLYFNGSIRKKFFKIITNHPDYIFYKAVKYNVKYKNAKDQKKVFSMFWYGRIVNNLAAKYGIELYGKYGHNLKIWHGNIVVNSLAIIGDNCQMHGNNCIGTNGKTDECPIIGNNVDIGFGSMILGNINVCNNVIIGANSLVIKSITESGVYAGSPAKKIGDLNEK